MTQIVYNKNGIPFDIDAIATDINGKADKDLLNTDTDRGVLVESYQNGTSWYRVYYDGWCEQGGQSTASTTVRTVNFMKPFVDTNYYASATKYGDYRGTNAIVSMIATKSANSMEINNASTDYPTCMWQACGYIA